MLIGFLLVFVGSEKCRQDSFEFNRGFLFIFIGFQ